MFMRRDKVPLYKFIVLSFVFLLAAIPSLAQDTFKGRVINKKTQQGVVGATILGGSSNQGTSTDKEGNFFIKLDSTISVLEIRAMGFKSEVLYLTPQDTVLNILLEPEANIIEAVDITQKRKYNRKNPAVELIDLVIKHKKINKLEKKDSLYFEQYDKIKFGMVDPEEGFKNRLGDLSFFFKNVDTSLIEGKELLTLFMQENLSDNFVKQSPSKKKQIIKVQHKTEFDPRYVNNPNIESYMNYLLQPVDIYDESIFFINKLILSPIADRAKLYYKYYISDTIRTDKEFFIRLKFEPFNMVDVLFKGELIVSMDGRYAVKSAKMEVDKSANISWVTDLRFDLSYYKNKDGIMLQDTSDVFVVFGRGKKDVLFGHRLSVNQKYDLQHANDENVFSGPPVELKLDNQVALNTVRPIALNPTESRTYSNVDSINDLKSFRFMLATGYLLAQGYYSLGKFEVGPLEYVYHKNNIEGNRFRLGGRSTAALSDKVYLEGYIAYGTQDDQFKYYLKSAVSLNGESVAKFPAHYVEASVQHDIFEPGKAIGFLKGDSFFRSFRSNRPMKWLETDAYRLGHLVEFGNHFSIGTHFTHQRRTPTGDLLFPLSSDTTQFLPNINTNDLQMVLRWAPFEKFYYRNLDRSTVVEKYPIFNLQYNKGIKGFWGGNYNYDALRFSASKRFFLNQLGFGDMTVSAGKIWGTLPYPLLEMPNIQEQKDRHTISYEMTNNMEFVTDKYIKMAYDHEMNGYILNKIPLLKKLKWREIFGVKMFYGKLSDNNNPYLSPDVIGFDRHEDGYIVTNALAPSPYWEGYIGVDNIFRILRFQYVKRLNYRHLPDITKERYKVSINFNF